MQPHVSVQLLKDQGGGWASLQWALPCARPCIRVESKMLAKQQSGACIACINLNAAAAEFWAHELHQLLFFDLGAFRKDLHGIHTLPFPQSPLRDEQASLCRANRWHDEDKD